MLLLAHIILSGALIFLSGVYIFLSVAIIFLSGGSLVFELGSSLWPSDACGSKNAQLGLVGVKATGLKGQSVTTSFLGGLVSYDLFVFSHHSSFGRRGWLGPLWGIGTIINSLQIFLFKRTSSIFLWKKVSESPDKKLVLWNTLGVEEHVVHMCRLHEKQVIL